MDDINNSNNNPDQSNQPQQPQGQQNYNPNQQQNYNPNQQQNYNPNQQQNYNPNQGQQNYNPNQGQQAPYQQTINIQMPVPNYPPKSKVAAGLLGIFLGVFGIHNFYLGFKGKALAQLLICVLTCGIGGAITSIWGFIEGIMILCGNINADANGVPLI